MDSFLPLPLWPPVGPFLLWGIVVVGWTAMCLWLDSRSVLGRGKSSRWRRLIPFFGPLFLIGTLQLGSRITGPAMAALALVSGLIVVRELDVRSLLRSITAAARKSDGSPLGWNSLRQQIIAWLQSPEATGGQASTIVIVRKDGTPFGKQDVGSQGSAALQRAQELFGRAVGANATDVHLEPNASQEIQVRFRIDGMLQSVDTLPAGLGLAVISILKVVSDMDIAERRRPQDGAFVVLVGPRRLDIRAASGPTNFGEKLALRLLDAESGIIRQGLEGLGMPAAVVGQLRDVVQRTQGMLIVCGPTGSGKTTSIYGALKEMDALTRNIVTIEDPIEYRLENVSQTAVNNAAELTFSKILRSVLRQDPDVVLVGEVRDRETAEIAMQAALTGHLVLTTLHANDTATTITRLIDIGIDSTLIQSTVTGILAQRLLRVLCPACKAAYRPSEEFLRASRVRPDKVGVLYKEVGCEQCLRTGYRGRTGIYEYLPIGGEIRSLLVGRPSIEVIREAAAKAGAKSLKQAALRKVLEGVTSVTEAKRVTA